MAENLFHFLSVRNSQVSKTDRLHTTSTTASKVLMNRKVKECVVFGNNRPAPGVLLSLNEDPKSDHIHDEIRAFVTSLNPNWPTYVHMYDELILFASPERPFVLTDKGTVNERVTLALYAADVEDAYARL